jgi:hypothetical protein
VNLDMIASSNDTTVGTVCAKEPTHHSVGIIDRREIEFGAKVLVSAIAASLSKVDAIGLPAVRPSGVRFCPKEGLIEVLYDPSGMRQTVKVSAVSLGAFLVAYCIRARIPMPRLADKTIHINTNSIFLAFTTHYAEAPVPDAAMGSAARRSR